MTGTRRTKEMKNCDNITVHIKKFLLDLVKKIADTGEIAKNMMMRRHFARLMLMRSRDSSANALKI